MVATTKRAGSIWGAAMLAATVSVAATAAPDDAMSRVRDVTGVAPSGGGHGSPQAPRDDGPSADQRAVIWNAIDQNRRFRPRSVTPKAAPLLQWPLQASPQLTVPGFHGISNFIDHNTAVPNQITDYMCGGRSYDQSGGYNHAGTDIYTWPFAWLRMSRNDVRIVAAAPGQIVFKSDGNPDQSCAMGGGDWNAVYIEHDDGSILWYGHMKNGSQTTKAVGERVAAGEFLGVVGSSGNSTGPHLHLEMYDANGDLEDPWAGTCNDLPKSAWKAQRPYYDSAINLLTTGTTTVVFPTCPGIETPNIKDSLSAGTRIFLTAYYRDQQAGFQTNYTLTRPDGSVYSSWTHSSPSTYSSSYWYWYFDMPADVPPGTWKWSTKFMNKTIDQYFNIGDPTKVTVKVPNGGESYVRGTDVTLKWTSNIGGPVRVELWKGNAFSSTLFASTPNDGVQKWTIPANFKTGTTYKLRVIDLADETVVDSSNQAFTITGS